MQPIRVVGAAHDFVSGSTLLRARPLRRWRSAILMAITSWMRRWRILMRIPGEGIFRFTWGMDRVLLCGRGIFPLMGLPATLQWAILTGMARTTWLLQE